MTKNFYLGCVGAAAACAAASVWLLVQAGVLVEFRVADCLFLIATYILVLYPGIKLWQWTQSRARPVLAEMGSVYTDRFDRVLIAAVVAYSVFAIGKVVFGSGGGHNLTDPRYEPYRAAIVYFTTLGVWTASVAMVIDQGWRFFDFRIANTYIERARRG